MTTNGGDVSVSIGVLHQRRHSMGGTCALHRRDAVVVVGERQRDEPSWDASSFGLATEYCGQEMPVLLFGYCWWAGGMHGAPVSKREGAGPRGAGRGCGGMERARGGARE